MVNILHSSKPLEVRVMVIEPGRVAEHDFGTIEEMASMITHDGKQLKLDRDEVVRRLFTEKNWRGKPKRYYVFCKMNGEIPELIGLEEFNPYHAISAEEADLMVHESVTMRGVRNLVSKIGVKGGSRKLMVFLVILVFIIMVVVMSSQGLI